MVSTAQQQNITRVRLRIAGYIRDFCKNLNGVHFQMKDLLAYVRVFDPQTAPDSPSRILRDMRTRGELDYEIVSRRGSLYRLLVRPQ